MTPARRRRVLPAAEALVLMAVVLRAPSPATGQETVRAASPPTVQQIAERMERRNARQAAALQGYVSRRVLSLVYNGFPADRKASETVELTFTAPSTKRFVVLSGEGSSLLRDRVFKKALESEQEAAGPEARRDAALTPANYDMRLVGEEHLAEGDCYVLAVSPRTKSRFAYEGRVWVHSTDFAVVRTEGRPAKNPSFWVRDGNFTSQNQKLGEFWLPRMTVSSSHVRLGGTATLTISYGPYESINGASRSAGSSTATVR